MPDPDQLAARISHDLRTPLNAVLGFSELMQLETRDRDPDCRYRAYAARIQQSGEALLKATEETLVVTQMIAAAARPERRAHHTPVSMTAVIQAAIATADGPLDFDSAAIATLAENGLRIEGCEAAYREALVRLIRSFNAAAPGGKHRLTVRTIDDQLLITLDTPAPGSRKQRAAAKSAANYPLTTDTLDLFIVQTMFAIQGADMSWVTDRDGRHLTARILIPTTAQWSLPLEA